MREPNNNFVFILPSLVPAGAEKVLLNYLEDIQSDPKFSHYSFHLIVVQSHCLSSLQIPSNVTVHYLGCSNVSHASFSLNYLVFKLKPCYLFLTHPRLGLVLTPALLLLTKTFFVLRLINTVSLTKTNRAIPRWLHYFFFIPYLRANLIIAQTPEMKIDFLNFYNIPSSKILVQRNPVSTHSVLSRSDPSLIPQEHSLLFTTYNCILASGRLAKQKGYHLLLHSFAHILDEHPCALVILGRNEGELSSLKQLASDLGIANKVFFLGQVSNPYPYYKLCKMFVLSSLWEGLPNVILENYLLNTPIVSTMVVPALSSYILNGVNGYLCPVNDIESLTSSIKLCLNLSRQHINNPPLPPSRLSELL